MRVDIDQLAAIDVHVHAERTEDGPQDRVTAGVLEAAARCFGGSPPRARSPTTTASATCWR
jgi:hypothetical protein